jgi:ribosomal protein S18 acetylase RimI-like enzyme
MTVSLRPLLAQEFGSWHAHMLAWYEADLVTNAGMPREAARAKATADSTRAFANGFATPGNVLLAVEEDGVTVGSMWFQPRERHGVAAAFLLAIEIDEDERGRGLGRRAMQALEADVQHRGLEQLELNVFGGNERARSLYRSLGFAETAVHMAKDLA